jgi:hypothetical protein
MKFKNNLNLLSLLVTTVFVITSCGEDDPISYEIPTTYNFENIDYNGQIQRLAMLKEMSDYMKTANTAGNSISANRLKAMFENNATNANFIQTYDASKQLKNKTFENDRAMFEELFELFETASQNNTSSAVSGTAGVQVSLDGTKAYFVNENGVEYAQIIEKGLMGSCFYYQATAVYMGESKMDVDNAIIEPGEGTAMEHHWDEAFGYLGVPTDFPTNTDGLAWWGVYVNRRDPLLGTNQLMDEFIKGRAAISNNDLVARDEAITAARLMWELASAGTVVNYLNTALANFNDDAIRNHALSEAVAFAYALKFNPDKKATNANIDEILVKIGGTNVFKDMNFYNTTTDDLTAAKNLIVNYFSAIEAVKDDL